MYHFWIQQLKFLCCFYHVQSSITYEEKHILSFFFIWPQQIHCIVENNSDGGIIHSFQHFTRQQEYFSRLYMFKGAHNTICYKSTIHITGFIYGDPWFDFSYSISYSVDCILVARSKIILYQRGFGGNGMSCVFSKNFRKLAASTLCKGMFDETIILQRSLENSYALPNIDELLCDISNSNRCLFSAVNSLFTQLLCLAALRCCCT